MVILAHGSNDARWRRPFEALLAQLEAAAQGPVALAYLQFCQPDLAAALADVQARGATEAVVIPAFMSGGGHLLRDVPEQVAQAAQDVPDLAVTCAGALAEELEVAAAMVAACLRLGGGARGTKNKEQRTKIKK